MDSKEARRRRAGWIEVDFAELFPWNAGTMWARDGYYLSLDAAYEFSTNRIHLAQAS